MSGKNNNEKTNRQKEVSRKSKKQRDKLLNDSILPLIKKAEMAIDLKIKSLYIDQLEALVSLHKDNPSLWTSRNPNFEKAFSKEYESIVNLRDSINLAMKTPAMNYMINSKNHDPKVLQVLLDAQNREKETEQNMQRITANNKIRSQAMDNIGKCDDKKANHFLRASGSIGANENIHSQAMDNMNECEDKKATDFVKVLPNAASASASASVSVSASEPENHQLDLTQHVQVRMYERGVSLSDLQRVKIHGSIINNYEGKTTMVLDGLVVIFTSNLVYRKQVAYTKVVTCYFRDESKTEFGRIPDSPADRAVFNNCRELAGEKMNALEKKNKMLISNLDESEGIIQHLSSRKRRATSDTDGYEHDNSSYSYTPSKDGRYYFNSNERDDSSYSHTPSKVRRHYYDGKEHDTSFQSPNSRYERDNNQTPKTGERHNYDGDEYQTPYKSPTNSGCHYKYGN